MKKLLAVVLTLLFLSGCGAAARQSEFYQHDTMYRNESHLLFSIYGFQNITPKKVERSKAQEWWGIPVEQSK